MRPVAALYATRITGHEHSHRTGETLAPLSRELGLPVHTQFGSDEYALLARSILSESAYRGKTVVICWTHHNITELAKALGVTIRPLRWKDNVFERLWIITLGKSGGIWRDVPQHLLAGDSKD